MLTCIIFWQHVMSDSIDSHAFFCRAQWRFIIRHTLSIKQLARTMIGRAKVVRVIRLHFYHVSGQINALEVCA